MWFLLLTIVSVALAQFNNGFNQGGGYPISGFDGDGFLLGEEFNPPSTPIGVDGSSSYSVRGRLTCGISPATNVRVVMWENSRRSGPVVYQELSTDAIGGFSMKATSNRSFMRPQLTLYHDCNDQGRPGLRKVLFQLPSSYTNQGNLSFKTFDFGTMNLETIFPFETRTGPGGEEGGYHGYRYGQQQQFQRGLGGHQQFNNQFNGGGQFGAVPV